MNKHTFVLLAYKESKFLEKCLQSLLNQTMRTNIVIATSTPNEYISKIAKKYDVPIIINNGKKGIGNDFNFAINCVESELVTIAHQDDIYEKEYAENILKMNSKYKKISIIFTDYYEIKNNQKIAKNKLLVIKKILLWPLLIKKLSGIKFLKRLAIAFGDSICCPSVTFVKNNIIENPFDLEFKCDVDWSAWEKLSKNNGKFIYIRKKLMCHRIHNESTTTDIINQNIRTKEDESMFAKFWPKWFAKIIAKIYKKSEKSNFN